MFTRSETDEVKDLDDEEDIGSIHFETRDDTDDKYEPEVAVFVETTKGKTALEFNGYRYRKVYKSKTGSRWVCSADKYCSAYLYLSQDDVITQSYEEHGHPPTVASDTEDPDDNETAMVITSRKGKEMLLLRKYTYRKQYSKNNRSRWICSNLKNCRAFVFTDSANSIMSAFEEHCHDPPKYYLKPDHVIGALRQPLLFDPEETM